MTPKTKLLDFIKEYVRGGDRNPAFWRTLHERHRVSAQLKDLLRNRAADEDGRREEAARLTRTGGGNQPSGHGARPAQDPGAVVPPGYPASSSLAQALALAASSRV